MTLGYFEKMADALFYLVRRIYHYMHLRGWSDAFYISMSTEKFE